MGYNRGNTAAVGTSGLEEKGFANCSASGKIKGDAGTYGGFIGVVNGRAHRYDDASSSVSINAGGKACVGGFVGATGSYFDHMYTFNRCVATGTLSGGTVGGFAGSLGVGGDGSGVYAAITKCTGSSTAKDFIGRISSLKNGQVLPVDVVVSVAYTGKAQQLSVGGQSAVFSQNGQNVKAIDCGEYQMDLSLPGNSIKTKLVILPADPSAPVDTPVDVPATLPPKTGVDGVEGYAVLALASLLCAAALIVLRRRTAR